MKVQRERDKAEEQRIKSSASKRIPLLPAEEPGSGVSWPLGWLQPLWLPSRSLWLPSRCACLNGSLAVVRSNSAFVFIKPHANTEATRLLVKDHLLASKLRITTEFELTSKVIDEKKLIDRHYYAIASKATLLQPAELDVPADKFFSAFGEKWEDALAAGKVFNALDACDELGLDPAQLDQEWARSKEAGEIVKFGGGFYCGKLRKAALRRMSAPEKRRASRLGSLPDTQVAHPEYLYSFNAFFMTMRSKYTEPGASIHCYVVEWDAAALPWAYFRANVIGPTDPTTAAPDSLRGKILAQWEALGLEKPPDTGDNGVHASASAFEAMAERINWQSTSVDVDSFGAALLRAGVPREYVTAGLLDPKVLRDDSGKQGSLFDALDGLDSEACIEHVLRLTRLWS